MTEPRKHDAEVRGLATVEVGDVAKVRILQLATVPPEEIRISMPDGVRSVIGALVQQSLAVAPGLATAGQQTLRLVFDPEIQRQLNEGVLQMMKSKAVAGAVRASAVDAGGTIRGNASIVTDLNPASVALGLWQLATIATAQAHLANIDRELRALRDSLNSLHHKIDNQHLGRIEGNLSWLNGVTQVLCSGRTIEPDQRARWQQELEALDRESLQLISEADRNLKDALQNLVTTEVPEPRWLGIQGPDLSPLERAANEANRSCAAAVEAARLRLIATMVRAALGGSHARDCVSAAETLERTTSLNKQVWKAACQTMGRFEVKEELTHQQHPVYDAGMKVGKLLHARASELAVLRSVASEVCRRLQQPDDERFVDVVVRDGEVVSGVRESIVPAFSTKNTRVVARSLRQSASSQPASFELISGAMKCHQQIFSSVKRAALAREVAMAWNWGDDGHSLGSLPRWEAEFLAAELEHQGWKVRTDD